MARIVRRAEVADASREVALRSRHDEQRGPAERLAKGGEEMLRTDEVLDDVRAHEDRAREIGGSHRHMVGAVEIARGPRPGRIPAAALVDVRAEVDPDRVQRARPGPE